MAKGLDIRRRIRSVKNTKAITKAMEMVAASKMRKAQEAALRTRSYAEKALEILANMSDIAPGRHPYLSAHAQGNRFLILLVTPNKGLCGSLNANLLRSTLSFVQERETEARTAGKKAAASVPTFDFITLGKKGRDSLLRLGRSIRADYSDLGDVIGVQELRPIAREMLDGFAQNQYDAVYAVYTHFYSVLAQKPVIKRILPLGHDLLDLLELTSKEFKRTKEERQERECVFEPSADEVLSELLPRLTEMQVLQAVLEAQASEQSARMVAMQNATKAAGELIDDLTLTYNKTRQAAITQEISEIVGGVEALKK